MGLVMIQKTMTALITTQTVIKFKPITLTTFYNFLLRIRSTNHLEEPNDSLAV